MKTQLKVMAVLVFCAIAQTTNGQRPILTIDACPNPNGAETAHFAVRFFLTFPVADSARVETGAASETVEQIRPVADTAICSVLNQIVRNNPKYKSVDDNLDIKRTKYFYRTDNLYYIFWDRKPEYDDIPHIGPKKLFIVVSADYNNIWEYYF